MEKKIASQRREVSFKLADVLCPDQDVILAHIGSGVEVVGKVSFFSDSGTEKAAFAIVEVPGIAVPLVVPSERLRDVVGEKNQRESWHHKSSLDTSRVKKRF